MYCELTQLHVLVYLYILTGCARKSCKLKNYALQTDKADHKKLRVLEGKVVQVTIIYVVHLTWHAVGTASTTGGTKFAASTT